MNIRSMIESRAHIGVRGGSIRKGNTMALRPQQVVPTLSDPSQTAIDDFQNGAYEKVGRWQSEGTPWDEDWDPSKQKYIDPSQPIMDPISSRDGQPDYCKPHGGTWFSRTPLQNPDTGYTIKYPCPEWYFFTLGDGYFGQNKPCGINWSPTSQDRILRLSTADDMRGFYDKYGNGTWGDVMRDYDGLQIEGDARRYADRYENGDLGLNIDSLVMFDPDRVGAGITGRYRHTDKPAEDGRRIRAEIEEYKRRTGNPIYIREPPPPPPRQSSLDEYF